MSFEINPVLAGKFDAPDYTAASNVNTTPGTSDVTGPDSRRYTQFDRSITDAGSTTDFSFSDLVDMLNPLEHIPIVSSIYRAITNEQIDPVSRVAGDILYGGLFGVASAVFGAVSATADTELVAETGKDSGGLVMAALFGPDETQNEIQLADAGNTAAATDSGAPSAPRTIELTQTAATTPRLAALDIGTNTSASPLSPDKEIQDAAPPQVPPTNIAAAAPSVTPATDATMAETSAISPPVPPPPPPKVTAPSGAATTNLAGMLPLLASAAQPNSIKQPYGGVMAPPNSQAQDMAMALAQGAPSTRFGNKIYANRLANGVHPLPPMLSSNTSRPSVVAPMPAFAPPPVLPASLSAHDAMEDLTHASLTSGFPAGGMSTGTTKNPLPPDLAHDMMLKALDQYKSIAAGPVNAGRTINVTN